MRDGEAAARQRVARHGRYRHAAPLRFVRQLACAGAPPARAPPAPHATLRRTCPRVALELARVLADGASAPRPSRDRRFRAPPGRQVVGLKYVRLYAPSETPKLYVRRCADGGLCAQGNVSEVDVEAPDLERHPLFADAAYEEVVLRPGEMLFIPARTWHYVRGLSTSWSISFWF